MASPRTTQFRNTDVTQVLARSKLWTPELDKLLRRWNRQIEIRRRGHYDMARKWTKRHFMLGVPATVLSTLIATGTLSTFRNCSDSPDTKCEFDEWIRLGIGLLGVASVTLTATQTFMNYQEAAESHKSAADNYESLHGVIESILIVPTLVRGDPVSTLHSIRSKYDDTVRKSPNLPQEYQSELSFTTVDLTSPTGDDRPTVVCTPCHDLSELLNIENDFESNDDQEVCLGFDLDQMVTDHSTPTALVVANIAAQKHQELQTSLVKALEFEMERLSTPSGAPMGSDIHVETGGSDSFDFSDDDFVSSPDIRHYYSV